ncbi:sorbosone dehydrogenase family protein [Alloacidobacterium sp.]|uniref:PQQ-dependent sugar dehydrogenase n=1 Tax=Alloacidobacterium sp. TaxID=2951999 RepID=UPI002D291128|nr:sorbosone dehydrogenase family protein [Alloacidobacterium sp.]HYK36993.1 sorbosone dehydrogenase family protein [Alloacidobacterium sp.]
MRRQSLNVAVAMATFAAVALLASPLLPEGPTSGPVITGKAAFTDYTQEKPGIRRKITLADLPQPYATKGVDNGAQMIKRPDGAWPQAPAGFKVTLYEGGLVQPRLIRTAPNGDLFVAMSSSNEIMVFRGVGADGKPKQVEKFADGLSQPFGIAFYPSGQNPQWVYVGNTDSVVRFPYKNGDMKARGPAQKLADLPGGGRLRGGGHWTRDIVFSQDGTKMFVSVGSHSNVDDPDTHPAEFHRADVLEFTPEGKFIKVYAYGIRNCVGEAVNPTTGQLWCSTNERDMLGDDLVPDYITHIEEGGFYGWPWWYMGGHQDPRLEGKHPELKDKVITPDVLLQPHFASLEMNFYEGSQFPADYKGDAFAAEHGSWNKSNRVGYEVIRVPMQDGKATGEYDDFLTGFTTADGHVWGRPVGVAVGNDGSLFVTDDGSGSIWHVTYTGK